MPENRLTAALFSDPETDAFLTDAAELRAMVDFEAALAIAEAKLGVIPAEAGPAISSVLRIADIPAADLVEGTIAAGVPVPELVAKLRHLLGAPFGQYVHWGATSQDAVDTGLVLRLRSILDLFEERLRRLVLTLADTAEEHADLPMAGRTRSQIATPVTFGLRLANWLAPLVRCLERLDQLRPRLLVVQLGGASGSLSVLGDKGPEVTAGLARLLNLRCPAKPWHTERDGLVELGAWLTLVTGLLGRIGADLMLMGRSEIAEARAGRGGGSSTMPQKANPVGAETLQTLARATAGHFGTLSQALVSPEERDGVSWSSEWLSLPPMLSMTGAGLRHALVLAETLQPDAAAMARAMESGDGTIHAEAIAFALAEKMPLGKAQTLVKNAAQGQGGSFLGRVAAEAAAQGVDFAPPDPAGPIAAAAAMVRATVADARMKAHTPR